jgi:hypothetical protein
MDIHFIYLSIDSDSWLGIGNFFMKMDFLMFPQIMYDIVCKLTFIIMILMHYMISWSKLHIAVLLWTYIT